MTSDHILGDNNNCLPGGEDNTIKLMESQYDIKSSTPLLEAAYAGVVKHPFPLNCLIKHWYLGADFYQAVKIGIVQYVCAFTILYFLLDFKWKCMLLLT